VCAQAGRTKDRISILKVFLYFLQMPHVFKIKISVLQVMALAKRQKGSLPEFCCGFRKVFGFFIMKAPLPNIES
jgi:hypothetical protein